jgi:F0F1-type ATP synthase assembly protein I
MPLDDEEKRELIEKIREHRRKIWLGEVADTRLQKEKEVKRRIFQKGEDLGAEPLVTRPVKKRRSKAEKEFWDESEEEKGKLGMGIVALVLSGLITSIAVGVLIGYLLATFL